MGFVYLGGLVTSVFVFCLGLVYPMYMVRILGEIDVLGK